MDEQAIRDRAYALWEKEGQPDGRDAEFWERARLMLEQEAAPPPATSTPPGSAKDKPDTAIDDTFPASDPPAFTAQASARKTKAR